MAQTADLAPISGDIAAAADVTVNSKGGSLTATLRKSLRDRLGELGGQLSGAALQFATGQAVVLLAGGVGRAPVRVRKLARNRFEIELDAAGDEEMDEVTAAFVRLKKDQFLKDKLRLSEPVTAGQWRTAIDEEYGEVRALLGRKRRR